MSDDTPDRPPSPKLLDELEHLAITLDRKQRYDERNRLALLAAHGLGALLAAALIGYDEPSVTVQGLLGKWTDAFNTMPAIGGATLLLGLAWGRKLALEATGMGIILAWDLGMAVSFGYAARIAAHDGNPATVPASYPLAVYGTLGALLVIHLVTLVTIILGKRP